MLAWQFFYVMSKLKYARHLAAIQLAESQFENIAATQNINQAL
jgi:hypothetical protein